MLLGLGVYGHSMHDVSIHVKRFVPMPAHCPAARHDPYRCVCTSARARLDLMVAALAAQLAPARRPWWRPTPEGP